MNFLKYSFSLNLKYFLLKILFNSCKKKYFLSNFIYETIYSKTNSHYPNLLTQTSIVSVTTLIKMLLLYPNDHLNIHKKSKETAKTEEEKNTHTHTHREGGRGKNTYVQAEGEGQR